jgi:quinolinate synthase
MDITEEIKSLKKEKNAVILAHNYQMSSVQDMADFVGDSLELAIKAKGIKDAGLIVFCGVRFMAETAKILNPEKKVLLVVRDAGCPLADMAEYPAILEMKKNHPEAMVVSYVNTTAEVKSITDVCCTSSNAPAVVKNVPSRKIIFLPDKNLGYFVQKRVPEKQLIIWDGYCFVHRQFTLKDIEESRRLYPDAEILVHPECNPDVQENADFILSTSGMLKRAKESPKNIIIVGTEEGILHRMEKENPGKRFYSLGSARMCINMKKTTPEKLKDVLENEANEIILKEEILQKARKSLEEMIKYI